MLINFLRTKIKGVSWRIDLKRINEMNELITFSEEHFSNLYVREIFDEASNAVRMRVQGVVQEADSVNKNKRLYPKKVLDDAVKALVPKINVGQVFGEVDHPGKGGKPKDTSHILKKLWWDERNPNRLLAEMLILETPSGSVIKEILRAGGRPGLSSRGRGQSTKVNIKGYGEVERIEEGFKFTSFDFVIDPSVRSAKIQNIIENTQDRIDMTEELELRIRKRAKLLAGLKLD